MLKALFLGVFVAVVLTVKAQKAKENLVVLDVKGVEKKENSLKNLKIPKLNLNDLKKGEAFSVLREIKRNDFEKLTNTQKRMLLKKMKKEAKEMKRLGLIKRLKRKFAQKRKLKLKRQEKKAKALKKMLKRKLLKKFLAKKAHRREYKKRNRKHHKRGKNHNKREKNSDSTQ